MAGDADVRLLVHQDDQQARVRLAQAAHQIENTAQGLIDDHTSVRVSTASGLDFRLDAGIRDLEESCAPSRL
jgi:hypothetical protein